MCVSLLTFHETWRKRRSTDNNAHISYGFYKSWLSLSINTALVFVSLLWLWLRFFLAVFIQYDVLPASSNVYAHTLLFTYNIAVNNQQYDRPAILETPTWWGPSLRTLASFVLSCILSLTGITVLTLLGSTSINLKGEEVAGPTRWARHLTYGGPLAGDRRKSEMIKYE